MKARPYRTVTIYSARTYFNMGKMPPMCAPDHIVNEYLRLRIEAGETVPLDELLEEVEP